MSSSKLLYLPVQVVLNGYNGTITAYGQIGTGKTYTVSKLRKDDASERGIMVRALEDIIASASLAFDSVEMSYIQALLRSSYCFNFYYEHTISSNLIERYFVKW